MNFELTEQQKLIITTALDPKVKLIQIDACAGASKTFSLVQVAKAINKRGRYLAFNKAIVKEASQAFKKTNTEVITTNAIAFRYVCTQGLIDDKTARAKFNKIASAYIGPFKLKQAYSREYLSMYTEKVLPEGTSSKVVDLIEEQFNEFIGKKRPLNPHFNIFEIRENIDNETKREILEIMMEYFNSKYIILKEFLEDRRDLKYYSILKKYILRMVNKEMSVPFAFNLKYYHILLQTKSLTEEHLDLLMLDEVADSSEVVLETFKLVDADLKIMVGDIEQSINGFAGAVNGFEYFKGKGVLLHLSQSFRCSVALAKDIENFGRKYLNPEFEFKGFDRPYPKNPTIAYLSRTNAGLINTLIDLHKDNIDYKLIRPVKSIFGLIKTLCYLSPKGKVYGDQYQYLKDDIKAYNNDPQASKLSLLTYVKQRHEDNIEIQSAVKTIMSVGRDTILNTMEQALRMEKKKKKTSNITVSTGHGVKGKAWNSVYLNKDLNVSKITVIKREDRTPEQQETLRLFYVCASRAIQEIHNPMQLKE